MVRDERYRRSPISRLDKPCAASFAISSSFDDSASDGAAAKPSVRSPAARSSSRACSAHEIVAERAQECDLGVAVLGENRVGVEQLGAQERRASAGCVRFQARDDLSRLVAVPAADGRLGEEHDRAEALALVVRRIVGVERPPQFPEGLLRAVGGERLEAARNLHASQQAAEPQVVGSILGSHEYPSRFGGAVQGLCDRADA